VPNIGTVKVDTYNEQNVYTIGSRMSVVCDYSGRRCIRDAFFEKWRGLINLAIGLAFFVPSIIFLKRDRRARR